MQQASKTFRIFMSPFRAPELGQLGRGDRLSSRTAQFVESRSPVQWICSCRGLSCCQDDTDTNCFGKYVFRMLAELPHA